MVGASGSGLPAPAVGSPGLGSLVLASVPGGPCPARSSVLTSFCTLLERSRARFDRQRNSTANAVPTSVPKPLALQEPSAAWLCTRVWAPASYQSTPPIL